MKPIVFSTKISNRFKLFYILIIALITSVCLFGFLTDKNKSLFILLIYTVTWVFTITLFLVLMNLPYQYILGERHLTISAGLVQMDIKYKDIDCVKPSTSPFVGFKLIRSEKAIDIYYKNAIYGYVKISPHEIEEFLEELEKRTGRELWRE